MFQDMTCTIYNKSIVMDGTLEVEEQNVKYSWKCHTYQKTSSINTNDLSRNAPAGWLNLIIDELIRGIQVDDTVFTYDVFGDVYGKYEVVSIQHNTSLSWMTQNTHLHIRQVHG